MLAYVRAALPPAGARVLEVGAGDGTLAAALREAGYEVRAIDPAGGPGVQAVALAELEAAAEEFDAAVAVLSLHHVEPLAASCARLAQVLRPGARLVVDELDADRVDARAAAWWLARRAAAAAAVGAHAAGEGAHAHAALTPDGVVADLRAHVHPLARVLEALHPWFALGEPVRGPYLHRWHLPPGLREAEEALIAAGALPATGARLVGIRR